MARPSVISVEGEIVERLTNALFRVELPNGHRLLGHPDRKMQSGAIQMLPGDKVLLEVTPYDLTKGRITFRQK